MARTVQHIKERIALVEDARDTLKRGLHDNTLDDDMAARYRARLVRLAIVRRRLDCELAELEAD